MNDLSKITNLLAGLEASMAEIAESADPSALVDAIGKLNATLAKLQQAAPQVTVSPTIKVEPTPVHVKVEPTPVQVNVAQPDAKPWSQLMVQPHRDRLSGDVTGYTIKRVK
jgi:hypothetical protein